MRTSRVGLSLVGAGVGVVVGVLILGSIVAFHLFWRSGSTNGEQLFDADLADVEIELRDIPDGARLWLDGQQVDGPTLHGVAGTVAVLEVESPPGSRRRIEVSFGPETQLSLSELFGPRNETVDGGSSSDGGG